MSSNSLATIGLLLTVSLVSGAIAIPFANMDAEYSRSLAEGLSNSFQCSRTLSQDEWIQLSDQNKLFLASQGVFFQQRNYKGLDEQKCRLSASPDCVLEAMKVIHEQRDFFAKHIAELCPQAAYSEEDAVKVMKQLNRKKKLWYNPLVWRYELLVGYYLSIPLRRTPDEKP